MFKSTGLACYLPKGLLKYISQGLCTGTTARMGEYLITYWSIICFLIEKTATNTISRINLLFYQCKSIHSVINS